MGKSKPESLGRKWRWLLPVLLVLMAVLPSISPRMAAQAPGAPPQPVDWFTGKPRVVIISDIGNEPDDQMSFVQFLLSSKSPCRTAWKILGRAFSCRGLGVAHIILSVTDNESPAPDLLPAHSLDGEFLCRTRCTTLIRERC